MPAIADRRMKVFVYGTLKRDEPNHYWLLKQGSGIARFAGKGNTVTRFPLLVASQFNLPLLLNKPGVGNSIAGEVYDVDDAMLANLDVLEYYPTIYDRQQHEVLMEDG